MLSLQGQSFQLIVLTDRIDPKVRTRGSVRFRADVKIYDQIGNRVISISKENNFRIFWI